jgi:hypothetical protein
MKRYTVTVQLYVFAENDNEARETGKDIEELLQSVEDNHAKVIEINETPFAKMISRKVEL